MTPRLLCLILLPLMLSGCTLVGAVLDKQTHEFVEKYKAGAEKPKKNNEFMKAGFEMDKELVKRAIAAGDEVEEQVVNVPSHCKGTYQRVCSEKESVCVCVRGDDGLREKVKVVGDN
ncbi:hypothetical protein [Microbulbifer mangrovi]|uniref:hypothetical protein n=1 Tax=Microbulbifer mangrovi TaxID=927787 RepID=UPI0009904DC4|nr:hypothetical protein [Microbulbifer mangrovi]